jgi:hypothetical protein
MNPIWYSAAPAELESIRGLVATKMLPLRALNLSMAHMPTTRKWARDELLVALNLYRKLSFGQLHARNPVIIELAAKLDRSANSVAMKLCNFASLDPLLRARACADWKGRVRWSARCGRSSCPRRWKSRRKVKRHCGIFSARRRVMKWRWSRSAAFDCVRPSVRPNNS